MSLAFGVTGTQTQRVGWRAWLGLEEPSDTYLRAENVYTLPPQRGDVAQVSHLPAEVAASFGINTDTVRITRNEAMSIASVRRARQIITGSVSAAPLVAVRTRAGAPPERVPRPLLERPDPDCIRAYTIGWTLDDLLFHGISWWRVLERDSQQYPSKARRVPVESVTVDPANGVVRFGGEKMRNEDVIRFDGPDEGVLKHGARTLRTTLMLEEAVRRYARMDVPLGYLQGPQQTPDEVQEFLDSWESARRARSTGYIPEGWTYNNPGIDPQKMQLTDARDHQAAEVARLFNLPPSAVNAPSGDSLTYATTESNRRELVDLTLQPFLAVVEQTLSLPHVTPLGTVARFDLTRFVMGDTKAVLDAAAVGIQAGVLDPDEVRVDWLGLPPLNTTPPAQLRPAPAQDEDDDTEESA